MSAGAGRSSHALGRRRVFVGDREHRHRQQVVLRVAGVGLVPEVLRRIHPVLDDLHLAARAHPAEHRAQSEVRSSLEVRRQLGVSVGLCACRVDLVGHALLRLVPLVVRGATAGGQLADRRLHEETGDRRAAQGLGELRPVGPGVAPGDQVAEPEPGEVVVGHRAFQVQPVGGVEVPALGGEARLGVAIGRRAQTHHLEQRLAARGHDVPVVLAEATAVGAGTARSARCRASTLPNAPRGRVARAGGSRARSSARRSPHARPRRCARRAPRPTSPTRARLLPAGRPARRTRPGSQQRGRRLECCTGTRARGTGR